MINERSRHHKNGRRKLSCVAVAAAVILATVGCSAASDSGKTVKVGLLTGSAAEAPIFAAEGEGFFKQFGIEMQPVASANFPARVAGLKAGSIDITIVGDVFQESEAGVPVVGLTPVSNVAKVLSVICNPSVNAQSGTPEQRVQALAGKKISLSGQNSPPYYLLMSALHQHGLDIKDVTVVNTAVGATQFATLEGGQVDCTVGDQSALAVLTPGGGRYAAFNFADPGITDPSMAKAVVPWVTTPDYAQNNRDEVIAFERATSAALLWMAKPENFKKAEEYVVKAIGAGAAPKDPEQLARVTTGVIAATTNGGFWGAAGANDAYQSALSLGSGVIIKPIPDFDPAKFVGPGSPSTMEEAEALAAGKPVPGK